MASAEKAVEFVRESITGLRADVDKNRDAANDVSKQITQLDAQIKPLSDNVSTLMKAFVTSQPPRAGGKP